MRYLGVELDLYSRLRTLTSANWRVNQLTSRILYKSVFLPRITYEPEIWSDSAKMKKSEKKLCSIQRPPLIAMTAAYRTALTNCLSVIVGVLPLDLEIEKTANFKKVKIGEMTIDQYRVEEDRIFEIWKNRYEA